MPEINSIGPSSPLLTPDAEETAGGSNLSDPHHLLAPDTGSGNVSDPTGLLAPEPPAADGGNVSDPNGLLAPDRPAGTISDPHHLLAPDSADPGAAHRRH